MDDHTYEPHPPAGGATPPDDASRDDRRAPVVHTPFIPGHVPWGWRQATIGLLIALAPEILLALLSLAGSGSGSSRATTGLAVATVISALILDSWYVGWAWGFSLRKRQLSVSMWGYRPTTRAILWLIPVSLGIVYAVTIVHDRLVHPPEQAVVTAFPHTTVGFLLFAILACGIAPVLEETFFRGFLFQGFARSWGPVWGAIVSSAIFSAVHEQLTVFVPLFTLGLLLCWVFYRTRSIWTNIALHATFNAIAVLAFVLTKG
jgi:membrane protease YdiL (CAAX protease family)